MQGRHRRRRDFYLVCYFSQPRWWCPEPAGGLRAADTGFSLFAPPRYVRLLLDAIFWLAVRIASQYGKDALQSHGEGFSARSEF